LTKEKGPIHLMAGTTGIYQSVLSALHTQIRSLALLIFFKTSSH